MLKYMYMMSLSFGDYISKIIPSIPLKTLVQSKYDEFVNLIIELGEKTAAYVKETLYYNKSVMNNISPNLSIRYITGLADYITEDTILDVKVLNHIDEKCIRQVLGYHYLSTKRFDLHITRVIVYDASSGRSVVVPISQNNCVK